MKPKCLNNKCLVKIKNDENVKYLIDLSNYFKECILVFVTITPIEVHNTAKINGYDDDNDDNCGGLVGVVNDRLILK